MSVITRVPEPKLWDEICRVIASERPPFKEDDAASIHTTLEDFDPARHNPVFFGKMHQKIPVDECEVTEECDPALSHPAVVGHVLLDRPAKSPPPTPPSRPDLKKCPPRVYLESYIFPVLLPALEEMLKQAKLEKCFERKRTKFNGLDSLTEYLYYQNPGYTYREGEGLGDIPFVKEHWIEHPRPPLPMSLLWTEEEAALILQSFWRGYKVRCNPQIQELRKWQREWREENANIQNKVSDFWAKQMPEGAELSPTGSQTELTLDTEAEKNAEQEDGDQTEAKPDNVQDETGQTMENPSLEQTGEQQAMTREPTLDPDDDENDTATDTDDDGGDDGDDTATDADDGDDEADDNSASEPSPTQ